MYTRNKIQTVFVFFLRKRNKLHRQVEIIYGSHNQSCKPNPRELNSVVLVIIQDTHYWNYDILLPS